MNLKELLARLKALNGKMEDCQTSIAAAEAAGKTDEVKTLTAEFDGAKAEFDAGSAQVERLKAGAEARAKRAATLKAAEDLATVDAPGVIPSSGPVQSSAQAKDEDEKDLVPHFLGWLGGKSLGGVARDAMTPQGSGWKQGANGLRLPRRIARAILPEAYCVGKALPIVSTGTPGSQLFASDFQPRALRYGAEYPNLFGRCFKVPVKSGTVLFPKVTQGAPGAEGGAEEAAESGYVAVAWTSEGAEKPDAEPTIGQLSITAYEVAAKTMLSQTLLNRSAIDVEALLAALFRDALAQKIDRAILNGDGNGKPTGILQTASLPTNTRVASGAVSWPDLVNVKYKVAPQFRANLLMLIQDTVLAALEASTDDTDRPLWAEAKATLGSTEVVGSQLLPALGSLGDVIACDPSQYIVALEQDIVIARSEHFAFDKGCIAYRVIAQIGGKVGQLRAFAALSASQT
jgi:HK97 family phage major capsid protein